ncbi:DNA gyrase subunit A [Candidatus Chlorohelix sp.]|uniref:DNA gyrase subunit A n=1 Tax=Candidatus Chlorohelix sp. TaxID=3139201 RepID=UPI0030541BEB
MEIGNVRPINIEDEMRTAYLDYAMSVIVQRALPDVRDGLKPVHRRILHSMNENGIRSTTPYKKCARIVGDVLGKYHPHGQDAVYETLVRFGQDFSMRYMLIDGQGNFGSVDGDPPAAMRYTEARMAGIADELLQDIDKDTVEFQPNYDGLELEPKVLPAKLPNLLLNGVQGIAVGMATNIPPHNLNELADAIIYLVDNPEANTEELSERLVGPDFPTGGIILGKAGIREAYATGRGRMIIRAKAHVEENKGRFSIIVTELPYMCNKRTLQERIAELVKDGKIDGISDMNDESDRNGIRLVVDLKRDAQPQKIMNQLFKYTQLQTSFSINMLALVENGMVPRVLPLRRILQSYIEWRQEVITRRTRYDLNKAQQRAHILEGLLKAIANIDKVIQTIRESKNRDAAKTGLIETFQLSPEQAQAILDMQLGRLAALERQRIEDEFNELQKTIASLQDLLDHPQKILEIIKKDLQFLKEKYGDVRRTLIIEDAVGDLSVEDLIPDEVVLVSITNKGYVKRLPHDTYKTQRRGGKGVNGMTTREQDVVQHTIICNTMDSLLFFTNKGRVFQLKVHEVPDAGRTAKGLPLINLIAIDQNEQVTSVIAINNFEKAKYLVMATRQGKIKRTNLREFSSVRSNGLIAIRLEEKDELGFVWISNGLGEVILTTAEGKAIRFKEEEVRPIGRDAMGVNAIKLVNEGDYVVGMDLVDLEADLLIITALGFGKRTPMDEFPVHGRYGQGVIAMRLTPKTGLIVATRVVSESDDVMLMTTSGMLVRIPVREISRQGRAAQGVTVMSLGKAGDSIASVAVVTEERTRFRQDENMNELKSGNGNGLQLLDGEVNPDEPENDSDNGHEN